MNLVSVFSLRIVTLQMSVVTICTGCWLVGELLIVFFYKASQPPQSSKSKQWYPGSTRGFSRTDFTVFPWGLWNEDTSSMFGLGKHHCRIDCYQALMPKRFSSDHVWTLRKPTPKLSYRFMQWVPQFNGSVPVQRTDHGLHGGKHDINLQKDCNAT